MKTFRSRKALIISISSDIGCAMAKRWKAQGMEVGGTYRTSSRLMEDLKRSGIKTFRCDVAKGSSVRSCAAKLAQAFDQWDYLVLAPGTQEPVGPFAQSDFGAWAKSVEINFLSQLNFVHALLPSRNRKSRPVVLFFAGGGTNNATVNYSAYTISKIALIKMCELLDAEVPDVNFLIMGPGWVKTKIHRATLDAGAARAGANYQKTIYKLASGECTPMERVLDCCDWLMAQERPVTGGRNFSCVFDPWGSPVLVKKLLEDADMYKLRRHGNDWKA